MTRLATWYRNASVAFRAAGVAAVLLIAIGLFALAGGRVTLPDGASPSVTCGARASPGALLAIADDTSVTGQRIGVADKAGSAANGRWVNPGIGVEDSVVARAGRELNVQWTDGTSCLGPWTASVLPYFTSSTNPAGSVPQRIAARATSDAPAPAISVPGQGDWILRVDLSAAEGSAASWYWRVRVGMPGPVPVGPATTPAAPCTAEDPTHAPDFILRTNDEGSHQVSPYGSTWSGKPIGDGTWVPTESIQLASGSGLEVDVSADVCAIEWTILYGESPRADAPIGFVPNGDLVPPVVNRDRTFASQDRFVLSAVPSGTWLIAGEFGFVNGLALVDWKVTVH